MTQCGLTVSDYTDTVCLIVYTCTLNFIEREESVIICGCFVSDWAVSIIIIIFIIYIGLVCISGVPNFAKTFCISVSNV